MPLLRAIQVLCTLVAACLPLGAQNTLRVVFSTDRAEVASSGAGGSLAAPGNATAVFRDECIAMAYPAAAGTPPATFLANRGTWPSLFGDENANGVYTEYIVGKIDAIQLAPNAGNPPSLFDFYISTSQDVGGAGALQGTGGFLDGDIVRLKPGGGFSMFLSESQAALAMGTNPATLDLNGFAIHPPTGDLYWTTTTTQLVNGFSLQDGGVVRLPASAYTTNSDGTVASVVPGGAQIALFEASLDAMFTLAGAGTVGDLDGITMDPNGGTFVGPTGLLLPHLWFAADSPTSGPKIVSSRLNGSIASYNGVALNGHLALGLGPTGFLGDPVDTISALDASLIAAAAPPPPVIHAHELTFPTPGVFKMDFGACTPNGPFYLLAKIAQTSAIGGSTARSPLLPSFPTLNVPGSFPQLYLNDFLDPLFLLSFSLPPVYGNAAGLGSFLIAVPPITPGLGICFQGIDASRGAITPPFVLVFQ